MWRHRQVPGQHYHRLAPFFPPGVSLPLDAVKRIPDMVAFAEQMSLADTAKWLR